MDKLYYLIPKFNSFGWTPRSIETISLQRPPSQTQTSQTSTGSFFFFFKKRYNRILHLKWVAIALAKVPGLVPKLCKRAPERGDPRPGYGVQQAVTNETIYRRSKISIERMKLCSRISKTALRVRWCLEIRS